MSLKMRDMKRGDTIIEVSLAFAIFSLVAIITVSMMNLGLSASERSLELVTARNELNAQAEALRFIHSSYISESTLPTCDDPHLAAGESCQQYKDTWESITGNAISFSDMTIDYPLESCSAVYERNNELLNNNNAFIINTRMITSEISGDNATIWSSGNPGIFVEPTLGARIIYTSNNINESSDQISDLDSTNPLNGYLTVKKAEGIWIIPVKGQPNGGGSEPQYYDFYIETCWYGSGNDAPTSLDTVVRLYNPRGA